MKVLVIGSGGREHALAWACHRSRLQPEVICAPGNGGTALIGKNVPLNPDALEETAVWAAKNAIDLVVIGPEAPLVVGLADVLRGRGLKVLGPSEAAARIEGSKAFSKTLMREAGVPTPDFKVFDDMHKVMIHLNQLTPPIVIKASGLAAGKGVIVCDTIEDALKAAEDILIKKIFGFAGQEIVIEECLSGRELSLMAMVDGEDYLLLPPSRDHKRAFDGDQGTNTGGMGAYAPLDDVSDEQIRAIVEMVFPPILNELTGRGIRYSGCLYAGIMLTNRGPQVLEFNCRFGDPEAQVLLPLMKVDCLELFLAVAEGRLKSFMASNDLTPCGWRQLTGGQYAATIVAAEEGYPGYYRKDIPIASLPRESQDLITFHAGSIIKDEVLLTNGGRVLAVTGLGGDLNAALSKAYAGLEEVQFEGVFYRRDIGKARLKV